MLTQPRPETNHILESQIHHLPGLDLVNSTQKEVSRLGLPANRGHVVELPSG